MAGAQQLYNSLRTAFLDLSGDIYWQSADDDNRVTTTHTTCYGTHNGESPSITPTGDPGASNPLASSASATHNSPMTGASPTCSQS
ncbi:hypothetical protein DFR74_11526 [Nocardia puris]|uniref:Uncharacterized protein n=1 Tax=Nocardia puris TaxID=208602 RepID=A0A366D7B8_9NOCA|nr:hypothetical protein DFR74_11526 [Nocardia puris]